MQPNSIAVSAAHRCFRSPPGAATRIASAVFRLGLIVGMSPLLAVANDTAFAWKRLADLPDSIGVAGAFAGVTHGSLVVGGGANCPDGPPWKGGEKVWHDKVYRLDHPDGTWKTVGVLPRALGYGVTVTYRDRLICVGGSDADRHYEDVFSLALIDGRLVIKALPALPVTMANGCGALLKDTLYVAGGQERPDSTRALRSIYRIDLAATTPRWESVDPCPGCGRILATAAAGDGAFWVFGGAELVADAKGKPKRRYLCDAYRYDNAHGWKRIADLPHAVVAAPSPALYDGAGCWIFGGDDGQQQCLKSLEHHQGFSKQVLRFDLRSNQWQEAGRLSAAHVTAPCVIWKGQAIIASGEVRPGVRSPAVWSLAWPPK